jgi:protein kinase-like protein
MGRTERNGHGASLRIAGRYRLIEQLGSGGMSVVWRGYDEILGRAVAVKVLAPRLADDQTFRDRLRQEALAAARLCHPHITGIFDFGESPFADQLTVPYVVMELNEGESVAARLARLGPLGWREAATVAAEVASALTTAHARGLVHRDVTPANVMLTGAGAKVVDFGISAVVGQRDSAPDGSLLGTPAYLAPERLGGAPVSPATDVYALGLLLYRALTGRLPWPAQTTAEALRAHLYADPEPVPALPGMPASIGELCLRCLAKRPADRPTAAEAARVLAATVGIQPTVVPLVAAAGRVAGKPPFPAMGAAVPMPGTSRLMGPGWSVPGRPGLSSAASGGLAGRRRSAGALRLRAVLKIGTALRIGGVRPLGGGLFAGGRIPRELLTGRAVLDCLSGRHRTQAALVTVALLIVVGLSWQATRETPDVEQAQAAGTAIAAPARPGGRCAVRYQLKRDSGSFYEAQLTVSTSAPATWRVQFAYPGTQRLTGAPRAITQKGRKVVVKGHGKRRIFTLRGEYRGTNPLPMVFTLDGNRCRAEILASGAEGAVSEAAASAKKQAGRAGSGGGPKRNRPPRKSNAPRKRVHTSHKVPVAPVPPAPTPAPMSRRATGYSLAW